MSSAPLSWVFDADYLQACNCDYGVPVRNFPLTTFSAVQETRFVPFEFRLAGRNSAARIGDSVAFDLEPVKNPVSGEPEFVRIEHATGFIFKGAEVVSARDLRVSAGTINFRYSDKAGFVTEVHYQN